MSSSLGVSPADLGRSPLFRQRGIASEVAAERDRLQGVALQMTHITGNDLAAQFVHGRLPRLLLASAAMTAAARAASSLL